jgi:hypothetical protein
MMNGEAGPPAMSTQSGTQLEMSIVELPSETDSVESIEVAVVKRGRGRPRKTVCTYLSHHHRGLIEKLYIEKCRHISRIT